MSRFFRGCARFALGSLRVCFLLMLLVIPVPVGEMFHRLLERRRRAVAAQVLKKPD